MDLIRSGKAPEVIRRKGAEGNLPLPLNDKIEILALLATDPDVGLRAKAVETLQGWDGGELRRLMASPQTAPAVLRFAAEQVLAGREDLREMLLWNPSLPSEFHDLLQPQPDSRVAETVEAAAPSGTAGTAPSTAGARRPRKVPRPHRSRNWILRPPPKKREFDCWPSWRRVCMSTTWRLRAEVTKHDDELTPEDRETLIEKINRMTVVEKIKAALTGNMETRSLLIRDSNKIISRAVLQSPKISETEAESYAAAKNVSEEVLRLIASNRKFMKSLRGDESPRQ